MCYVEFLRSENDISVSMANTSVAAAEINLAKLKKQAKQEILLDSVKLEVHREMKREKKIRKKEAMRKVVTILRKNIFFNKNSTEVLEFFFDFTPKSDVTQLYYHIRGVPKVRLKNRKINIFFFDIFCFAKTSFKQFVTNFFILTFLRTKQYTKKSFFFNTIFQVN